MNVACEKNLVTKLPDGSYGKSPLFSQLPLKRSDETPLIVIEGLDGSGKLLKNCEVKHLSMLFPKNYF